MSDYSGWQIQYLEASQKLARAESALESALLTVAGQQEQITRLEKMKLRHSYDGWGMCTYCGRGNKEVERGEAPSTCVA